MPKDEAERAAKKARKEKERAAAAASAANVASTTMSDVEMAMGDVTVGEDSKVSVDLCKDIGQDDRVTLLPLEPEKSCRRRSRYGSQCILHPFAPRNYSLTWGVS